MSSGAAIEFIRPAQLSPHAPYAYAAVVGPGRAVFTAGACPSDADGNTVAVGDVAGQATQVMANLVVALQAAGVELHDVVKTTVYVASTERTDLVRAWDIVRAAFGDHDAPSTLLGVSVLGYPHQLVEVEAVAVARAVTLMGPAVELVQLPAPTIHALAAGDLTAANRSSPIPLTPYFVDATDASVWRRRSRQIAADPTCALWITRAIWSADERHAVGRAGFHAAPDATGLVEIGYAVDPIERRRGYARAALEALLARAADDASVCTVRATIRPDNEASRLLVLQYGFIEVGEQWDDEDGLETIFEVAATLPRPAVS